jgi:CheY-like chemotaxis protein
VIEELGDMEEIFFVHDQQESPAVRKHFLETSGYKVTAMPSGGDCLSLLEQRKPSLVLLDVLIEGANGFELCRTIRNRFPAEELPIVLTSTVYHARIYRDEAQAAGAQAYVQRPIDPEDLVKIVNEVMTIYTSTAIAD